MNYHKLLIKQIQKHLPQNLQSDLSLQDFLSIVSESYNVLERDREMAERAFSISEEEYENLNQTLKKELELKKLSVHKLQEAVVTITGEKKYQDTEDVLFIAEYINLEVGRRKNAEKVFTSLIENTQSGILLEDETRHIVFTNNLFCDIFQIPVSPEHLQGVDCSNSAEQSRTLFKNPEEFINGIHHLLQEKKLVTGEVLELADGRILERDYIPIFIDSNYKGHLWSYTDITEKKKSQDAILQSEQKNRLIMNAALDGIITFDEEGIISFWNPHAERIFGLTAQNVIGSNIQDVLTLPVAKDKISKNLQPDNIILNKEVESIAYRNNKEKFPVELYVISIKDPNNQFYCCFIKDISERKIAEQKLESQRKFYEDILNNIPADIAVFNASHEYLFINPRGIKDDHLRKWIIGKKDEDYCRYRNKPLAIATERENTFNKVLHTKQSIEWEEKVYDANNNESHILRRFYPVLDKSQDVKLIIGYGIDITERKKMEQRIRANEEKYRCIIDNMNMGLIEIDAQRTITYANQSFLQMTDMSKEHIIGNSADMFVLPESAQLIMDKFNNRQKGISEAYEVKLNIKSGPRWWLLSSAPIYNDTGEFTGSVIVCLDIHKQKDLENNLREARELAESSAMAKQSFLANMSHEIRTPMNAIMGMANQLAKTSLGDEQRFYLQTVQSATENLLIILNDILDLSKIESGNLTIEKIGFEPKLMVGRVMQVMMYKAEEKGIAFTNSYCDSRLAPVLIGDPYRLNQILLNLVSNAIKFTAKGSVDISCKVLINDDVQQVIKISVRDTGIGMTKDFSESLFQKFRQEDESITRRFGGTGLGMNISKQLIELMGGSIEVDSEKDKGTTVSFTVAFKKGGAADIPEKQTQKISNDILGNTVILVADDNEMNRLVASTILKNYGGTIIEAQNGKEVIDILKSQHPNIILMDVQMPVMDGMEATQYIRKELNESIPIIALTAFAVKGDSDTFMTAGMNDYLSKPFNENELINMIAKYLDLQAEAIVGKQKKLTGDDLYNLSKIELIANGDNSFIDKMIKLFIKQARISVDEIISAYQNNDFEKVSRTAHRLKPSIDDMGIQSLQEDIRRLELDIQAEGKSHIMDQVINHIEEIITAVTNKLSINSSLYDEN